MENEGNLSIGNPNSNNKVKKIKNHLDLLKMFLDNVDKEYTIQDAQNYFGLSYEPAHRYMTELTQKEYLITQKYGKKFVYVLNTNNPEVKKSLELLHVIKNRDSILNDYRKKKDTAKGIAVFATIAISILLLAIFVSPMTGLFGFSGQTYSHSISVDIAADQNKYHNFVLPEKENATALTSFKISGSVYGAGSAKVYLEDSSGKQYLVLDSKNIETSTPSGITGFAVAEPVNEKVREDTSGKTGTKTITETTSDKTRGTPVETPKEIIYKTFNNYCEDTCDLSAYNLTADSYKLYFEVSDTEVTVKNVAYTLTKSEQNISHEKIQDNPDFEITVISSQLIGNELVVNFTSDNQEELPIELIGDIEYGLADNAIKSGEVVTLTVNNYTNQYFEMNVSNEIIAFGTMEFDFNPQIMDADGRPVSASLSFEPIAPEAPKGIGIMSKQKGFEIASEHPVKIKKGRYNIDVTLVNNPIKQILIKDLEVNENITEFIKVDNAPEIGDSVETYAIDPTAINFTSADVTVTAKGSELYKCKSWDFENQTCIDDNWTKVMDIVPGQDYTFTLTPEDPAYSEQPGSEGKDTTINSGTSTYNYGADATMDVRGDDSRRILLEFNLSGVPANSSIASATLTMYATAKGTANAVVNVSRMNNSWVEGTGTGSKTDNGATWNNRSGTQTWNNSGADFDPRVYTSTTITGIDQFFTWNVTNLVQEWANGTYTNYGMLIRTATTSSGTTSFASSDNTNATRRPKINITYSESQAPTINLVQVPSSIRENENLELTVNATDNDAVSAVLFELNNTNYSLSQSSTSSTQSMDIIPDSKGAIETGSVTNYKDTYDQNNATYGLIMDDNKKLMVATPGVNEIGTVNSVKMHIMYAAGSGTVPGAIHWATSSGTQGALHDFNSNETIQSSTFDVTSEKSWSLTDFNVAEIHVNKTGANLRVYEVWFEVNYTTSSSLNIWSKTISTAGLQTGNYTYNVYANDSSSNIVNKTGVIEITPELVLINASIDNSNGTAQQTEILIYDQSGQLEYNSSGTEILTSVESGQKDIVIDSTNGTVEKIELNDVNITSGLTKLVNIDDPTDNQGYEELYAIDPTGINFTDAVVTVNTAKGNQLYKCANWSFENQTCLDSDWVYVQDITPGENYTFLLTPEDPGFAEYNYSDTSNNKVYNGTNASLPITTVTFGTERTNVYNLINASDNNLWRTRAGTTGQYPYERFVFKINQSASIITNLTILWEGFGNNTTTAFGVNVYVLNFTGNAWVLIGSHNSSTDKNITKVYSTTQSINDTINSTGYLIVLAEGNRTRTAGGSSDVYTDFIEIGINYTTIPNVTLVSPANGNVTALNSVNFTCNVTDAPLKNMTLYWNYSGSWLGNDSVNVSGTSNNTTFQKTSLNNGAILWNCYVCNNQSECSFASSNWTVKINSVPTQTTPLLNSTTGNNYTTDNLTCYNQSTTDADGDSVKNIYNWYKNGVPIPVLNLPFEGGSNSTWTHDYSAYNNNGSVINATWNSTGGYDGKGAYYFNASKNASIALPNTVAALNITRSVSVTAWIKLTSNISDMKVLSKQGNTTGGYKLSVYNDTSNPSRLEFEVRNATSSPCLNRAITGGTTLRKDTWYFVVGVYDDNARTLTTYVNGVLDRRSNNTTDACLNATTPLANGTDPLVIGAESFYGATPNYFNGTIDDVAVYSVALSPQEINVIYQNKTYLMLSQDLTNYDNWSCEITPNDGYADGSTIRSNNVTIDDLKTDLVSPANGNVTSATNNVSFVCNATDAVQLKNVTLWWNYSGTWQANGTNTVTGTSNNTTFARTNLSNVQILWNCYACDNLSYCEFTPSNWTVTVNYAANNPVTLLLNSAAANLTVTYGQASNATASASSGTVYLYRNGSLITSGASPQSEVTTLGAGMYVYLANATGNSTGKTYNLTVQPATTSCSLVFDKTTPQTYGTQIMANCSCTAGTATLYRDEANVTTENATLVTLGVNTYNYTCNNTVTSNYTSATNSSSFVINKAATLTRLFLNGTEGNRAYNTSQAANFTVTVNISGKTVYLNTNISGWTQQSGATPLTNITTLSTPGYYNITGSFPGDANYTASSVTYYADVTTPDTAAPVVSLISPQNNSEDNNGIMTFVYNVTDASAVSNCSLIVNGSINQTNTGITKNVNQTFYVDKFTNSSFSWSINCTDAYNNRGSSETRYFRVVYPANYTNQTIIINETIVNSQGQPVNGTIELIDAGSGFTDYNTTNGNATNISSGTYNIKVTLQNMSVKTITFINANITGNVTDVVDVDDAGASGRWAELYGIKPTLTYNYSTINVTVTAKGKNMFKCMNWNFTARDCIDNKWLRVMRVMAGTNYTAVMLNASDPGFGETNDSIIILDKDSYLMNYTENYTFVSGTEVYANITVDNHPITKIYVYGHDDENASNEIKIDNVSDPAYWKNIYGMDPANLNFSSANVTINATGTTLFKCPDWNITTQDCPGGWFSTDDTSAGQLYNITLISEEGDPAFATYNYTDTTNNKAYANQSTSLPAATNAPAGEAVAADYQAINSSDNTRWENTTTATGYYAFEKFVFTLNQTEDKVIQLNITWEGYGRRGTNYGVNLYVLNDTGNAWILIGSHTVAGDSTLTKNYTLSADIKAIINSSNKLVLMAENTNVSTGTGANTRARIDTDFVKIDVLYDTQAPRWYNQTQNASTPAPGDSVKLSVNWTEDSNLSYAILETNETGTWQNKTTNYSSPLAISGTMNWSNFTWNNASIAAGTTVGWGVWANDTYGNWNRTANMTFTVTVANTAPNTTTPTVDPATAYANTNLYCNATLTDGEQTSLTAYWKWYKNDAVNLTGTKTSITNNSNTNITVLLSGNLTKGDNWTCEVIPNDGTVNGTAKNSTARVINDTVSTFLSFSVNDTNHNLNAKYSANISDADTISGCLIEHNNTDSSFTNTSFTALSGTSSWCNITILNNNSNNRVVGWYVWTNDSGGTWTKSALQTFTTTNTAPTSTAPTLNTTTPYTNETLKCNNGSFTDINGDPSTWYYQWYKNGGLISGQTSSTLDLSTAGNGDKGDTIICSTMAGDNIANESTGWRNSSAATVQNSIPVIGTPTVNSTTPLTNDVISCLNGSFTDIDSDSATWYYRWYDTNVLISGQNSATLDLSVAGLDKGDNLTCSVIASDGTANATAWQNSSNYAIIQNSAPIVTYNITFSNASAGHNFNATAGVSDVDGAADINFTNISASAGSCVQIANVSAGNNFNVTYNCTDAVSSANVLIGFMDKSLSYVQTGTGTNTYPNHAPSTTAPSITPASPNKTSTLTCNNGTFSDSDGDTNGTLTWAWYRNGTVIGGQTTNTLANTFFNKSDNISCTETPVDQYGLAGTGVSSANVTIQNSAPTTPTTLILNAPKVGESLTATCSGSSDLDLDSITYYYEFNNTNDNTIVQGWSTTSSYTVQVSDAHNSIKVTCGAYDGTVYSASNVTNTTAIANTVPSISSVDVTPDVPNTTSLLTCTPSGWSDNDSDAAQYYYAWFDDDTGLVAGQTSSTFDCNSVANCDKGDTITCQVTPYDGIANGTAVNGSELIENVAPTVSALVFTNATTGHSFNITVNGTDTDSYADLSKFSINDTECSLISSTNVNSTTNQTIFTCTSTTVKIITVNVTVNDTSSAIASVTGTNKYPNNAPTQPTATITPDPAYKTDNLNCSVSGSTDADTDTVYYYYNFTNGSITILSGQTSQTYFILNAGNISNGQTWTCTVIPTDTYVNGTAGSDVITISNSAPVIGQPTVNSTTPYTNDILKCNNGSFTDADGDTATWYYRWYDTGALIAGQTTSTIDLSVSGLDKGDTIICSVIADDGYENATAWQNSSNSAVIQNSAPTIAYQISFVNASTGHHFTATAGVTDIDGAADINFTNISSSAGSCNYLSNSTSGNNFNVTYNCTDAVSPDSIIIGFKDKSLAYVQTTAAANTYPNHAPTTTQPTISPASPNTTSTLTCNAGVFSDPDGDSAGTSTWKWFKNNALIGGQTAQTLDGSNFVKTEQIICEQTPVDQYGLAGTANNSTAVTIQNTAPTTPTTLILNNPKVGENLTAICSGSTDDDTDTIIYYFEFNNTNDNTIIRAWGINNNYTIQASDAHNTIKVICGAYDGTAYSAANVTNTTAVANTAPSIASVDVTPNTAYTNDDLTCTVSGWGDIDGDSQQYYYEWRNGTTLVYTFLSSSVTNVLGNGNTTKGETWNCTVIPYDGTANGTAYSDTVTILNTAPTTPTILTLNAPKVGESLTATCSGSSDLDLDSITYYYEFNNTNDNTIVQGWSTTSSYTVQVSDAHNSIKVTCGARDGTVYSVANLTNTTVIANTAPNITSVDVTPDVPNTTSLLTCTPSGWNDADLDATQYYYAWFDGVALVSGQTSSTFDCNSVANCDKGDTITCQVTPYDGIANGTAVNGSELIENVAPNVVYVNVTPDTAYTTDNLIVNATCTDIDNSTIIAYWEWYNNSNLVASLSGSTSVSNNSNTLLNTVASGNTTKGDVWKAKIWCADEIANSSAIYDNITILNTAPIAPTGVTIAPSPVYTDTTVTCTASGSSDADNDAITYYYKFNDTSGTLQNWATTNTFDCNTAGCDKGDTLYCHALASTNDANSTSTSNSTTILNSAPVASDVQIKPDNPVVTDNLTCNYTYTDVDTDAEAGTTFRWFKNDTLQGFTLNLVTSGNLSNGDFWICEVKPSDGTANGTAVNSTIKEIGSAAPSIVSVTDNSNSTNPTNVGNDVTFTVNWSDPDVGQSERIYICNTSNISSSGCADRTFCSTPNSTSNPQSCNYTTLQSDNTTMTYYTKVCDDTNKCSGAGGPYTFDVNHAPTLTTDPYITPPTAYTNTVLTCNNGNFNDVDSDTVGAHTYKWFDSGAPISGQTTTTLDCGTVPGCNKGDLIICEQTPVDSHNLAGTPRNSSAMTISNSAPAVTVTEPDGVNDVTTDAYPVTWTATDNDTDIVTVSCYADTDAAGYDIAYTCFTGASNDGSEACNVNSWTSGSYYIWCSASDGTATTTDYSPGQVTVDNTAPTITPVSPISTTYNATPIWFNATVDEAANLCSYSLDGTANVSMSNSSTTSWYKSSAVADGNHNVTFYCNDTLGTSNSSSTVYFTVDTTGPYWNNNIASPASPATYSPGASYQLNITWADAVTSVAEVKFEFNGVNYTGGSIIQNGNVYYITLTDLAANESGYTYKWYAKDSVGNWNNTGPLSYVIQKANPSSYLKLFLQETEANATIIYGIQSNATGTATLANNQDLTFKLYRNNAEVASGDPATELATLGYGTYVYMYNTTGGANYTAGTTVARYLTVNKADDYVNLTLNGVQGSTSIVYPATVNATATSTSGTDQIYRNNTNVTSEENTNVVLAVGYYPYKANTTGNANYTANSTGVTYYANISKATSTCSLTVTPASPIVYGIATTATCSCTNPEASTKLYRNGSDVTIAENGTAVTSAAGTWDYVCNVSASQNYTSASNSTTHVIQKAATSTALYVNGTRSNRTYDVADYANFTVALNVSGKTVYLNTTIPGWTLQSGATPLTNITQLSAGGIFNITGYFTGDQNYTASSETWFINVSDTTVPTISNVNATPNPANQSQTVNITANITDNGVISGGTVQITYPNGTSINYTMTQDGGNTWYLPFSSTQLAGTYNFTVYANDTAGNWNSSSGYNFTINDVTPPTITATYPTNGTALSSGTTTVTIQLTTNEQAICRYNTTNAAWDNMTQMPITNSTAHNLTINTTNGQTYNYYFICEDSYGNQMATSYYLTFSVAMPAQPPTVGPIGGGLPPSEVKRRCGDGICSPSELCSTCPEDCGTCPGAPVEVPPSAIGIFQEVANVTGPIKELDYNVLEKKDDYYVIKNNGGTPLENLTLDLVYPEADKPQEIHRGTKIGWDLDGLIGWKLVGSVKEAKLMDWAKQKEKIADILMPGEEVKVKINAGSPITKLDIGEVKFRVLSNNQIIAEETARLKINTPPSIVAGNYNKEDDTTDLYFVVNNKGNGQLDDVYIEFNLNEGGHTKIFEIYGPYNITTNEIFVLANKYMFNKEIDNKNYTMTIKVYSNLAKISESEGVLDLTEKEPPKTSNNSIFDIIFEMFK